jgi:hypothetical protein
MNTWLLCCRMRSIKVDGCGKIAVEDAAGEDLASYSESLWIRRACQLHRSDQAGHDGQGPCRFICRSRRERSEEAFFS